MITIPSEQRLLGALERARLEAASRGHDRVATRHLALGLLSGEDGGAAGLVRALGCETAALRRRLESSLPRTRRALEPAGPLPYSANAQRALALASEQARAASEHPVLRTGHLLLALLVLNGDVSRILRQAGVTAEALRERLGRLPGSSSSLPFLTVDAEAGVPVYQQIVQQIREGVAGGRLAPDDRLPTVRQLAAELGVAPGTTARAYQELEQAGVVVTGGPKGTRIAATRAPAVPEPERTATLVGLLRPVAVAASYLGASADEVRAALEQALAGIYPSDPAHDDAASDDDPSAALATAPLHSSSGIS